MEIVYCKNRFASFVNEEAANDLRYMVPCLPHEATHVLLPIKSDLFQDTEKTLEAECELCGQTQEFMPGTGVKRCECSPLLPEMQCFDQSSES